MNSRGLAQGRISGTVITLSRSTGRPIPPCPPRPPRGHDRGSEQAEIEDLADGEPGRPALRPSAAMNLLAVVCHRTARPASRIEDHGSLSVRRRPTRAPPP